MTPPYEGNGWVSMKVKLETREMLKRLKTGGETYDEVIHRLVRRSEVPIPRTTNAGREA